MAQKKYFNQNYTQSEDVCAMASYGLVIEYYSKGEVTIAEVLDKYDNKFQLEYFNIAKHKQRNKEKAISDHFHMVCKPMDKRGFQYIKELHEDNVLGTAKYCKIVSSEALKTKITDDELENVRREIIENNSLVMLLYRVRDEIHHAVVLGRNEEEQAYLIRDPARAQLEASSAFLKSEITEYIVFSAYSEKGDGCD